MARPKETNKRQLKSRSKNSFEQVLEWIKSNPGDAALLLAESVGMDPRPPWMREKKSKEELAQDSVLLAAGAVPGGGALRFGAKAAKATRKADEAADVAQAAAGRARPKAPSGRSGGSGTGQKPGGSNRLTPSERATRREGTKKSRTEEGARKLEADDAAASSSKSVNTGPASEVRPRPATGKLPEGVSPKDITDFASRRGFKDKRRAAKDIEETMKGQMARKDAGANPAEDIPGATSGAAAKPAKAKKPKEPKKAADRKKFTEKVKRDKAVKARKEKIEKDVREGRRQSVTDPRSYPSTGRGAEGPRMSQGLVPTGRGSTNREFVGRRTPGNLPAQRPGSDVVQGTVVRGGRNQREPIDMTTRPVGGGAGGGGRMGTPRAIGGSGSPAASAGGRSGMGRGKKAILGLGAVTGGGLLAKQFDSDRSPNDANDGSSFTPTPRGPQPKNRPTLRDKYGRDITRDEFAKREAYRERTKSMTAEERAKARKKEMKRRREYRSGSGSQRFGSGASTKTRNIRDRKGYAYMDMAARRNMR